MRDNIAVRLIAVACVVLLASGCADFLSNNNQSACETKFGTLEDVQAVEMDVPKEPRAIDTDDEALADSIRAHDGVAIIAFKPSDAPSVFESGGMRSEVPCEVFASGLTMVTGEGIEITTLLRSTASAIVEMDPDIAGSIRNHGLVDYIEPRGYSQLAH